MLTRSLTGGGASKYVFPGGAWERELVEIGNESWRSLGTRVGGNREREYLPLTDRESLNSW
ncbi:MULTISPECIES: hypothetical protein [Nostocales]|uniref:Uncharacterized protein n=3 Tax=Nostocales TaxID=1161 RepID=A0A0C1QZD2_9CYAN|nr:hypothetical protein [Tolypothrix bouteillei]KAF3886862.1 hypothetical protein DA73_0400016245 [Tolypothrix bouteillei VB521301]